MTNNSIQNGNGNGGQTLVVVDDPLFQSIPKNKPSFFIWRIEVSHFDSFAAHCPRTNEKFLVLKNMQLNTVPKDSYGTFFKGDTYIVYSAEQISKSNLVQHIHLWIGSESTTVGWNHWKWGPSVVISWDCVLKGWARNRSLQDGRARWLFSRSACPASRMSELWIGEVSQLFQATRRRQVSLLNQLNSLWVSALAMKLGLVD